MIIIDWSIDWLSIPWEFPLGICDGPHHHYTRSSQKIRPLIHCTLVSFWKPQLLVLHFSQWQRMFDKVFFLFSTSCSAGVGRTGTFIVIDSMIDMMHMDQRVDVFGFVSRIREQRCQLIQTDVSVDPSWPVMPRTDSSAQCTGHGTNKQGHTQKKNNLICDVKGGGKNTGT